MIRVSLIDDHQMFRKGMKMMLETFEGIEILDEAENGADFLKKVGNTLPDVVILDIQMPEMNGFETCKHITDTFPSVKILILSQNDTKEVIHKVITHGAHGFFTKNSDLEELVTAIRKINENGFYFANNLGPVLKDALLWDRNKTTIRDEPINLTPRELDIIKFAGREFNSNEIATRLFINVRTVETHRRRIMEKTESKNFLGVVLYAIRNNYVSIEDIYRE